MKMGNLPSQNINYLHLFAKAVPNILILFGTHFDHYYSLSWLSILARGYSLNYKNLVKKINALTSAATTAGCTYLQRQDTLRKPSFPLEGQGDGNGLSICMTLE